MFGSTACQHPGPSGSAEQFLNGGGGDFPTCFPEFSAFFARRIRHIQLQRAHAEAVEKSTGFYIHIPDFVGFRIRHAFSARLLQFSKRLSFS